MRIISETLEQSGHQLHRLILKPAGSSRGTLIFFHGQGDFIDRYPPILEPFTDNGLTCILTDLPGHGRSSGKRGHVPGLKFIDQLLDNALVATKGSCHIAGHSMGGMMALRCFLRDPSRFQSAWFSSPLLAPARQTTPCMSLILPKVARLFPWITWSTGVSSEQCRNGGSSEPDDKALYHNKISLGWARDLIAVGQDFESRFQSMATDRPILFTQGGADPVCTPEILRSRLVKLPRNQITYREITDALHEPFMGDRAEEFRLILENWLKNSSPSE
ncbi:lysophospholipase [Akkermansiaceae bacterium]|nr:lysophospholipase [Akkermansiaceae bacterium]MDB4518527.1 lysophospholipase [Akkermansiaceae bacterium]|tara:strand:- start:9439 stop:10263 length:825 start_codon:yes stop_codon:yes gene_type:complete